MTGSRLRSLCSDRNVQAVLALVDVVHHGWFLVTSRTSLYVAGCGTIGNATVLDGAEPSCWPSR